MTAFDKFDRLGQKIYNGQDILKNHILKRHPIHYTTDLDDYTQADQYANEHDFIWLVEKDFEVVRSFPWFFVPSLEERNSIHLFPYIYKASKRIKSWNKVQLVPTKNRTNNKITQNHIANVYDFYKGKDSFDIFYQGSESDEQYIKLKERFTNIRNVENYWQAQELSETDMFWLVPNDVEVSSIFKFSYQPDDWSHKFTHVFVNGTDCRDGIALFPKQYNPTDKELKYRYYTNKKELNIVASMPKKYPIYNFKNYEEYKSTLENTNSDLFWYVPNDVEVEEDFKFDLYFDHKNQYDRTVNHVFLNGDSYDGVILFSKYNPVTEKEFNHRFYTNKKEWEVVASRPKKFDQFVVNNYEDYKLALERSTTEMFFGIPDDIEINSTFKFDVYFTHHNQYDRNITHVFLNDKTYDGVVLFSKNIKLAEREVNNRFYVKKKEWDVIASKPKPFDLFEIDSYQEYLHALNSSKTNLFWASSKNIKINDLEKIENFYISHHELVDRNQNHVFLHYVNDAVYKNGIMLLSKNKPLTEKEVLYRFPLERKEWDIVLSGPVEYDQFNVETYSDYLYALENSQTEMFWATSNNIEWTIPDIYFTHDNEYDRKNNHAFEHKVDGKTLYNGLFLLSKHKPVTQKEIEYRHIVDVKEWQIFGSQKTSYEIFDIDSYDEYLDALETSKTELFWAVSRNINCDTFDFDLYFTHDNEYDRKTNHSFVHLVNNKNFNNGVFLLSKHSPVTQREIEHRFIVNAKEWNIVASGPVEYDIFTIDTWEDYVDALKESTTELFWATTNNINIDDFDFSSVYFTHDNEYDRKINHCFAHLVNGKKFYNGLMLLSKHSHLTTLELEHRFPVTRKEWDIVASKPVQYDFYNIDSYNDYLSALEDSGTELFWAASANIEVDRQILNQVYFTHDNQYDRKTNHSFIHRVNGKDYRNGLFLLSKHCVVSQKEIEHRFIAGSKEWDLIGSTNKKYDQFTIDNYNDYIHALSESNTEMFWGVPSDVVVNLDFDFDLYFTHDNEYDRKTNHIMLNGEHRDGVVLFSKHAIVTQREVETRFYINKKDWDIVASQPKSYEFYNITNYNDYLEALENSPAEMFWASSPNIKIAKDFDLNLYFSHHNTYDRKINHAFVHRANGEDHYNGLFLLSKLAPLTQKEIEHRLIAKRKEWKIVASGPIEYERYIIDTYEDYETAVSDSETEMFWMIPPEVNVNPNFEFDLYFTHNQWFERETNHVFKNGTAWDGISLVSKKSLITEREIKMRFLANKKQYDIVASNPQPYDIVFISKDEEHADNNYAKLTERFPRAKRVHGVNGIHAAHIEAAKLCSSDMIWIVDADAEIIDKFEFDYYVPAYDPDGRKTVHVWKSQNPINGLVYGYGAVKLLPRLLTLNMDTSKPDMTTSISPYFKSINRISNITRFNTDEFSTWRSAFRECVKLASKTINGQRDEETDFRLNVWCTRGKDKPFGEAAISGANLGKLYGEKHRDSTQELRMINDFEWLREQFDQVKNSL